VSSLVKKLRVLLVGTGPYQAGFFRNALNKLEIETVFVDEWVCYRKALTQSWAHKVLFRALGRRPLPYWSFNRRLQEVARRIQPSLVLVIKGSFVTATTLEVVKRETNAALFNFAVDDPWNTASSSRDIIGCIPHYDLWITPRRAVVPDLLAAGAKEVRYVRWAYDPAVHFPTGRAEAMAADVAFIGGADGDRVPFMNAIAVQRDVTLALYGAYWNRYRSVRRYARGVVRGGAFRHAVSSSAIQLCLVRRANRDGHVMRTFEIPACRGFMLAERTEEHEELFCEHREVVFFNDSEELADKVRYYLRRPTERERIASTGYEIVTKHGNTYVDRVKEMLKFLQ
jgi:spore maturation protein CgeB